MLTSKQKKQKMRCSEGDENGGPVRSRDILRAWRSNPGDVTIALDNSCDSNAHMADLEYRIDGESNRDH